MKILIILLFFISCASKNKTVIAHRGAPGYLPEHTLEGVAMAHAWGVDYIEPDVVITKDDKAVVLHDIHIDTTTDVALKFPRKKRSDGRYYAVDFTLEEIKKLNVFERINLKSRERVFKSRFSNEAAKRSSFKVPTLIEFIELVQGLNKTRGVDIGIYPELKSPEFHMKEGKDIAKIVFNILENYGYNHPQANIYVQCFYPPTLKRLRDEFKAKMPLVALIAENSWKESSIDYNLLQTRKSIKELSTYVNGIGPYLGQLVKFKNSKLEKTALVDYAHEFNLEVHPYTHRKDALPKFFSNDEEFFDFIYEESGVDGIFSDFGDIALKYSR